MTMSELRIKKLDGANFTHSTTHPSIQTLFGNQTIGCEKCYLPWHQRASVIYSNLKLFGDTCPINLFFRVRPGPIHQIPYLSRIFFFFFTLQSPLQTSPAEAARSRHHDYRLSGYNQTNSADSATGVACA